MSTLGESSKPVLLMTGATLHQSLFQPLSEHFQLAFLNSHAHNFCNDMGIEGTLPLQQWATSERIGLAQNSAVWLSYRLLDNLASGEMALDAGEGHLHSPMLDPWLPGWASERLENAAVRIMTLAAFMEDKKPVGIVVHEDVTEEGRGLALFAKERGIPCIHIPHANHFL